MSRSYEELARSDTPLGEVVLRRRLEPITQRDIFEVMLAGDGLMSSLITDGEERLAEIGLAAVAADSDNSLDIVVGGLGLGYTARSVLRDPRVRTLHVIDALEVVIDWHRRHLVPLGAEVAGDHRCTLVHGDFFALAGNAPPLVPDDAPHMFDAILVDIDHSPQHLLDPSHAALYTPDGLGRLAEHLRPDGVFALWSNDPPDPEFVADLRTAFVHAEAQVVSFWNVLIDAEIESTIYLATHPLR